MRPWRLGGVQDSGSSDETAVSYAVFSRGAAQDLLNALVVVFESNSRTKIFGLKGHKPGLAAQRQSALLVCRHAVDIKRGNVLLHDWVGGGKGGG